MDQKQEQTMYTVSTAMVARKNFVAGFTHSLGGFVVTLISWGFIYVIAVKLILPQLSGTIEQLSTVLKLLPKTSTTTTTTKGTTIQVPDNLMKQ